MVLLVIVVLGILQGLTEFLPVSSSAHLLLAQRIFGFSKLVLTYDIFLHAGTLLAVLLFFRRDILELADLRRESSRREVAMIIVASLPAAVAGLGFKNLLEPLFVNPAVAAGGLLFTALLLFGSAQLKLPVTSDWAAALLIGIFQAVAIVPGVSRSGATISLALMLGWGFRRAFRFSFLLSLPAVGGALLLELRHFSSFGEELPRLLLAAGTAFVAGMAALVLLSRIEKVRYWSMFGRYCALLGLAVLIAVIV